MSTKIWAVLKLILVIVSIWLEKDKGNKKAKKEIVEKIKNGIKENDPSSITAGFDELNRL